MPALSDAKLELFCQERAKPCATDVSAFGAAGYDLKAPDACDNFIGIASLPEVSARIAQIHVQTALGSETTLDKVIRQLSYVAFSDLKDFWEWGDTAVRCHEDEVTGELSVVNVRKSWIGARPSAKMDAGTAAIKKVWRNADGTVRGVELRDPIKALELLGKHLGMFPSNSRQRTSPQRQVYRGLPIPPYRTDPAAEPIPPDETREQWEARQKRHWDGVLDANRKKANAPTESQKN